MNENQKSAKQEEGSNPSGSTKILYPGFNIWGTKKIFKKLAYLEILFYICTIFMIMK